MGQQAEIFHGFIPCSLQSKTSLLAWTIYSLCFAFVLFAVFAFSPQQDSSINLLAILVGMLHMWCWFSGDVYGNWCLLNLIILAAATYHVKHSEGNQHAVWYTSIFIVLLSFIAILTYHIFQQVKHTKLWKKIPEQNFFNKQNLNDPHDVNNSKSLTNNPSVTITEVAHFDELCEPLLEDEPHTHHYTTWAPLFAFCANACAWTGISYSWTWFVYIYVVGKCYPVK